MCNGKCKCEHPEKLQGDPSQCTPEQIQECHGEGSEHPCVQAESQEE